MKLINIISLWFLGITLAALLIGTIVIYEKLGSEIDFELGMELDRQIESYADRIAQGAPVDKLRYDKLQIQEISMDRPLEELWLRDTLAYHDPMNRNETQLKGSRSFKINGKHYRISYYNLVVEADDITETIVISMLTVFFAQLLFIGCFLWAISKKIFRPFHQSLSQLQLFTLQKNTPLAFTKSGVFEFDLLNSFLSKMSTKLLTDYRKIKEFSENLSHEIQTPSAVVRGKLELLMNESINEQQADLIQSAFDSNERIRRIVKSLSILAKLENDEFESPAPMDFSEELENVLSRLEEIIQIHDIQLRKHIQPGVFLSMHPYVADILIHNLLSNSIRHNLENGQIEILLESNMLQIKNTGRIPSFDPKDMLERFKKDGDNQDSAGLGLAIVHQICKNYGFSLIYTFERPNHTIKIWFR